MLAESWQFWTHWKSSSPTFPPKRLWASSQISCVICVSGVIRYVRPVSTVSVMWYQCQQCQWCDTSVNCVSGVMPVHVNCIICVSGVIPVHVNCISCISGVINITILTIVTDNQPQGAKFSQRPPARFPKCSTGSPTLYRALRLCRGGAEGVQEVDPWPAGGAQTHLLHHLPPAHRQS